MTIEFTLVLMLEEFPSETGRNKFLLWDLRRISERITTPPNPDSNWGYLHVTDAPFDTIDELKFLEDYWTETDDFHEKQMDPDETLETAQLDPTKYRFDWDAVLTIKDGTDDILVGKKTTITSRRVWTADTIPPGQRTQLLNNREIETVWAAFQAWTRNKKNPAALPVPS